LPGLDPDEYPPIDPGEPGPDDAGELLPDTPDELPAAPVEPLPDDGEEGGVRGTCVAWAMRTDCFGCAGVGMVAFVAESGPPGRRPAGRRMASLVPESTSSCRTLASPCEAKAPAGVAQARSVWAG
jgi:hypothetical protein